jgi:hypothetical protein
VSLPSHAGPHVVEAPVPLHAGRLPCGAPRTGEHVPTSPVVSHAWHSPPHALSQHTPSMQNPVPHSVPSEHAVPFAFAQCPSDVARLHEKPAPAHAVSQQRPPTQLPLRHPSLDEQALPFACFKTHALPEQK